MRLAIAILCATTLLAQSAYLEKKTGVPAGHIDSLSFKSRRLWVYTPPAYDPKTEYPLIVFFDGDSYIDELPAPTVLNNALADRSMPPVIALFVDTSANRLGDLANHKSFADLLANEIVPFVRTKYTITNDPSRTLLAGYSAGGLAAGYVALMHPERFGNVFSQSGAYWRGNEGTSSEFEWVTEFVKSHSKLPVRFYLEVGAKETQRALGSGPVFVEANRRLVDALKAKGYDVTYREVPGAQHEPVHWRKEMPAGLLHFWKP